MSLTEAFRSIVRNINRDPYEDGVELLRGLAEKGRLVTEETHPTNEPVRPACASCGQSIPKDTVLMMTSLEGVNGADLAERFYARLFEIRPDLRELFPDVPTQSGRLAGALVGLAKWFDPQDTDAMGRLYGALQTMGWAHLRFSPAPSLVDYADVKTALVATLTDYQVGPAAMAAWSRAYDYAAGVMLATQATGR